MIRIRRKRNIQYGAGRETSASSAWVSDPQARLEIFPPNILIFFFPCFPCIPWSFSFIITRMPDSSPYMLFTDGACLGNPGPGGYAAIVRRGAQEREFSGGFRRTTNNRMEITAAIVALENIPAGAVATLYSDSSYVVQAVEQGWARRWKALGWRRPDKQKALNPDLWEKLLRLLDAREVKFVWVRGHAGHPENERCDRLSFAAAQRPNLPADAGYEADAAPKPPQSRLF